MSSTLKQRFADSFDESARKQETPKLIMGIALGVMTCAARTVSFAKGYDVACVAGARPMTTFRKVGNGLALGMSLATLVATSKRVVTRMQTGDLRLHGLAVNTTHDLAINVVSNSATGVCILRELSTGHSLFRKYPLSSYGKVTNAVSLVAVAYTVGGSARHLYDRRAQWLPELQELAFELKLVTAGLIYSAKEKVGLTTDSPALSDADF